MRCMIQPRPERMSGGDVFSYARHRPEQTLLYQLIERYWPDFQLHISQRWHFLPRHVAREFHEYLECGRLENGFLRVRCEDCHLEHLVAFSCKRRGFCPTCGVRRMAETAALLVDDLLPHKPIRQWVHSFPYPLRFLLSNNPQDLSSVLGIINRAISIYLIKKAGFTKVQAHTGTNCFICFLLIYYTHHFFPLPCFILLLMNKHLDRPTFTLRKIRGPINCFYPAIHLLFFVKFVDLLTCSTLAFMNKHLGRSTFTLREICVIRGPIN
jgi:ribosomal protein S27E